MRILVLMLTLGLAACAPPGTKPPEVADLGAEVVEWTPQTEPDFKPGECWDSDTTPAIIETVTEQKIVTPEQRDDSGAIVVPATYSTTTRQEIIRDRTEIWFRAPCPEVQDAEFIATLQRALKARGYYRLPLTGVMDDATAQSLRRYQAERGLDSAVLSLAAARELGLISTALEDL